MQNRDASDRPAQGSPERAEKFLTFQLATEEYAVAIGAVQEIVVMLPITPLPDAPPGIVGVVSLRGTVIPVIDMRLRLGLPSNSGPAKDAVVIVIRQGDLRVGLIVDQVLEVTQIATNAIEAPPAFGTAVASHLIRGLVTTNSQVRILLEMEAVIGSVFALAETPVMS